MTVTNNLAQYRAKKKLSQQALADGISVSRKTISSIETGRFTPSVLIALQLANFFECSVEHLFRLEQTET